MTDDVSRETTPLDYEVDTATVLSAMGIDPGTVIADSMRMGLVDNKLVITYSVQRAVPPRIMGMALIAGTQHQVLPPEEENDPETPEDQPEDQEEDGDEPDG